MVISNIFNDDFLIISIRIVIAALLCGLVGVEREVKRHPAGFRTHLLVGVGSCIMMLLSLYGFKPYIEEFSTIRFDPARIPSYVISGIGFLGAGTILVRDKTVRGLTTAASIWVVAGLGLIIGAGMYAAAILSTVVVLVSLNLLSKFEVKRVSVGEAISLEFKVIKSKSSLSTIISLLESEGISVYHISVEGFEGDTRYKKYIIKVDHLSNEKQANVYDSLIGIDGVKQII